MVWTFSEMTVEATDGSSEKPGLVLLRSICMAAAAACLVVLSATSLDACLGDPVRMTIHYLYVVCMYINVVYGGLLLKYQYASF
jgi:hypothetical protein